MHRQQAPFRSFFFLSAAINIRSVSSVGRPRGSFGSFLRPSRVDRNKSIFTFALFGKLHRFALKKVKLFCCVSSTLEIEILARCTHAQVSSYERT
jgi:hypothetical protein